MSHATTFFERVRNSGLIELKKLKQFAVSLHDGKRLDFKSSKNSDAVNVDAVSSVNWREMPGFNRLSPLDRFLAKELVRLQWLNAWQVSQLIEGRTKFSLGDFQIRDALGYGGYSHVFLGQSRTTSELVAIKVFQTSRTDPKEFSKFLREVTLQKSLDHRNLVRLLTHGHEGNVDYLVFEYMRGGDVRKRLRQELQLPVLQAIRIIVDAAGGLAYLHQRGMIHRDVKPANILLDETGNAKLGDMGLIGFLGDKAKNDPRFGKLVGTADYMAPDQIRNPGEPSVQWDIYSLGCTFYQMVTGIVPFPKGDSREKVLAHLKSDIVDPRVFRPDLPHDVARLLAEMTAKDPVQRTKNAKEIVTRLRLFLPSEKSRIQSHLEEWMEKPEHKTIDSETLKRLFDFSDRATLPQTDAQIIVTQESSPQKKIKNQEDVAFEKVDLDAVKNVPVEKEIYAVHGEQSPTKTPFEWTVPVEVADEELPTPSDQKMFREFVSTLETETTRHWENGFLRNVRRSLPLGLRLRFAKKEVVVRRFCRRMRNGDVFDPRSGGERSPRKTKPNILHVLWWLLTVKPFDAYGGFPTLGVVPDVASDVMETATWNRPDTTQTSQKIASQKIEVTLPGHSDAILIDLPPVIPQTAAHTETADGETADTETTVNRGDSSNVRAVIPQERKPRRFESLTLMFWLFVAVALTLIVLCWKKYF